MLWGMAKTVVAFSGAPTVSSVWPSVGTWGQPSPELNSYLCSVVQRRHPSNGGLIHVDPEVLHQVVNDRVV